MAAVALHSDHINYLIFRYLQEHGHESAATAFHRDWHRPSEYRDPESLPFARIVERNALISVVQKGILYDELSTKVSKHGRQFRWSAVNPRQPIDERETVQNGEHVERRGSGRGKKKARSPPVMRPPDEFPTPAPKRQRRSEGPEAITQVNGERDRDAMEVDAASPSAEEDAEGEVVSPAVGSEEAEMTDVPERYDSMEIGTQTETKTGPKTTTMYWKIDRPGAAVLHSIWNPQDERSLLTVGESLCRFYDIPPEQDGTRQITHIDDPSVPPNSIVTDAAWHPAGHSAACAIDVAQSSPNGQQQSQQMIVSLNSESGSTVFSLGAHILEPPGIILRLRYSPNGNLLLVVRTNLKRGVVQIWDTPRSDLPTPPPERLEPIAWRVFEQQVLDACWTTDTSFLVCGDAGLARLYTMDSTAKAEDGHDGIIMQGLFETRSSMFAWDQRLDKVVYDENSGVAVFGSTEAGELLTVPVIPDDPDPTKAYNANAAGREAHITALAFQPSQRAQASLVEDSDPDDKSTLLAVAFEEGFAVIYRITRRNATSSGCEEILTLELADGPALALAWSPSGEHLAVGGTEMVQVWSKDSLQRRNGTRHESLTTWRPDAVGKGKVNGERVNETEEEMWAQPSLSWSKDGEGLGFAVERQLAVIRFTPPLSTLNDPPPPDGEVEMNGGGGSP